jgi:hypothetical protein
MLTTTHINDLTAVADDLLRDSAGFTLRPANNPSGYLEPKAGYVVSLAGYEERYTILGDGFVLEVPTEADVRDGLTFEPMPRRAMLARYFEEQGDLVAANRALYFGCWRDDEGVGPDGEPEPQAVLDISVNVPHLGAALWLAERWGQKAIWDVKGETAIYLHDAEDGSIFRWALFDFQATVDLLAKELGLADEYAADVVASAFEPPVSRSTVVGDHELGRA